MTTMRSGTTKTSSARREKGECLPSQDALLCRLLQTSSSMMLLLLCVSLWGAPMLPITAAFQSTPFVFRARPSLLIPHTRPQPPGRKDLPIHVAFASVTNNSTGPIVPSWDPIPAVTAAPTPFFATARRLTPVAFGLIKAMAGTGMLALPLGLAVVTDHPKGLWPANVLMTVLGVLSAYTFSLYGRLVHATQAKSLGGVWKAIMVSTDTTSGTKQARDTSWIVSLSNFVYCFGCSLAYSLVLGDILSSLVRSSSLRLPAFLLTRQAAILGVTSCVLLPLSNLQSLAALAPVSIVGVLGTLFTTGFLGWRCPTVMANSPYVGCGTFGSYSRFGSIAPLMLVAMSCVAMMAHFSAPEFYHALKKTSEPKNNSPVTNVLPGAAEKADATVLRNFFQVTTAGFGTIGVINALTLAFGFLTFGGACQGNILSNFSVSDPGATLCRLLIGISVMGGFPMCIQPCRSAALEVLKIPETVKTNRRALGVLVGVLTSIALTVKDVGFVISMNGAVMGSNLMYTIPCMLFLKHTKSMTGARLRWERRFCRLLIGFGVVAMVAGAWVSILSSFYPHLL